MVTKSAKVGIGFLILLATISFPGGFILRHSGTVFAQSNLDEFVDYVGEKEAEQRQARDLEHSVRRWIKESKPESKPLHIDHQELTKDGGTSEDFHFFTNGEFFAIVSYKNIGGLTNDFRIEATFALYDKDKQKISEFPILPWTGHFYISNDGETLVILGANILATLMHFTPYNSIAFYNIPERKLIKKIDRSNIVSIGGVGPATSYLSSNGKYFAGITSLLGGRYRVVVYDVQGGNELWKTETIYGQAKVAISDECKVVVLNREFIDSKNSNWRIYFFNENGKLVKYNDLKTPFWSQKLFLSNRYVSIINVSARSVLFFDLASGQLISEKSDKDVVDKWRKR